MMNLTNRAAACVVLSAAFFPCAATLGHAQTGPSLRQANAHAPLLATGHQYGTPFEFDFTVSVGSNGSIQGHGMTAIPSMNAFIQMDITSALFLGDTLCVAGPVTMAVNAPPGFVVGSTAFFEVQDNGRHGSPFPDAFQGLGSVPASFGNLTIQEIIAILGPPPPQGFMPVVSGDIRTFLRKL